MRTSRQPRSRNLCREAFYVDSGCHIPSFWTMAHNSLGSRPFLQFCTKYGIKNAYSTPRYPQSNGQAEVTNKTLLYYLKKRLTTTKGKWVDELPIILWAYRTTPKWPTGKTPYAHAFGAKALIPVKSGLKTLRINEASELSQALD